MLLGQGDQIAVRDGSSRLSYFKELNDVAEKRNAPAWLGRDARQLSGTVTRMPERAEIDGSLDEQLIVEYYSRR
jgi:small subunit ribosomal protein S4